VIAGLLIAKISDRLCRTKAQSQVAEQTMFWFLGHERHAEGRDHSGGPGSHSWANQAIGALLGPKKATLRGRIQHSPWSSTATGWSGAVKNRAGSRPKKGPTLRTFVIAVLEEARDHRFHPRSFGRQLNGSAESPGWLSR
jgi:hypothetical protein